MSIQHAIWKVSHTPQRLAPAVLPSEQLLETMIVADPAILSTDWMLIGRQVITPFNGRIDLLALAPDGSLVLIEIKRDRTPREVVAQALDYASWIDSLTPEQLVEIYERFAPGHSLADDFKKRFGQALDAETLNQSHQIAIVAASLDESSERIVRYLNERGLAINVICFQVFANGPEQFISRSWLLDPAETQTNISSGKNEQREPWNGEFYISFGEGGRLWDEARTYGFISAGGGTWYTRTLEILKPGDRIWVNIPHTGYVGVGRVTAAREPAATFTVQKDGQDVPVLGALSGDYCRNAVDNPEFCEYFVRVEWLDVRKKEDAYKEIGLFGNQNTVCRPTVGTWRHTIERLKKAFPHYTT